MYWPFNRQFCSVPDCSQAVSLTYMRGARPAAKHLAIFYPLSFFLYLLLLHHLPRLLPKAVQLRGMPYRVSTVAGFVLSVDGLERTFSQEREARILRCRRTVDERVRLVVQHFSLNNVPP